MKQGRNPTSALHAVILAAGEASRFGSPKQLAQLGGISLLTRAISTARALCGQSVTVVIGAHQHEMLPELTTVGAPFVVNDQWRQGPGSSIAAGMGAIPEHCEGALLWHADQPLVKAKHLSELVQPWLNHPTRLFCASYSETIGVPVLVPKRLFEMFRALPANMGAKKILQEDTHCVPIAMPTAALDIDTPEDLAQAQRYVE